MSKQITIEIYKKIWPFALFAILINWMQFWSAANDSTLLPTFNNFWEAALLPFALETLIYSIWLQWSPQKINLWRQLSKSEFNAQVILLPSFLSLSLLVQLFPLLIFMKLSETTIEPLIAIDYLGFVVGWLWSLLAYGIGVIFCWWQRWTFGFVILSVVVTLNYVNAELYLQITTIVLLFILFFCFIGGTQVVKRFAVSLFISFGCYLCLSFTLLNKLGTAIYSKTENSGFEVLHDNKKVNVAYNFRPKHLRTTPDIKYPLWGFRADWMGHKLMLGQYEKPANRQEWSRNKKIIEQYWKDNHSDQMPVLVKGKNYSNLFFFKEAIYENHSNINDVILWQAKNQSEQITWYNSSRRNSDFSLLLFGNSKYLNWIIYPPEGKKSHQIVPITSKPKFIKLKGYTEDGVNSYELLIQTIEGLQVVYKLDNLFAEAKYVSSTNMELSAIGGTQLNELLSWTHYQMKNLWRVTNKPITPIWLIVISHLVASVITFFYFRADNFKLKLIKACFCFIFAWPCLLSLVLCFPKQKQVNWQLQAA